MCTAPTSMPLTMTHRRNFTTARSASVYSARLTLPSPVAARHSESDNHGGMPDRLSRATTQEPEAAVTQESASRGAWRSGTGEGSMRSTNMRVVVLLALPRFGEQGQNRMRNVALDKCSDEHREQDGTVPDADVDEVPQLIKITR